MPRFEEGEQVLRELRSHQVFLLAVTFSWLLLAGLALFVFSSYLLPLHYSVLVSALLFLVPVFPHYLQWKRRRYFLTNHRLIREEGLLGREIRSIGLEKVQDVAISYTLLGRLFQYGTLKVETAGEQGQMVLENIPHPEQVAEEIQRYSRALVLQGGGPEGKPCPACGKQIQAVWVSCPWCGHPVGRSKEEGQK
jgi:uncharacterized membrane protein YdbT with pleckstrin-like domain